MAEFVPLALACGHVVAGVACFEIPDDGSNDFARCDCPEGCGMQTFVIDPDPGGAFPAELSDLPGLFGGDD